MTNKESREREGEPVETYYSSRFEGKEKGGREGRGTGTMGFRANFTSLKIYRQDVKALIKAGLEQPLRFRNFPLRSFAVIASGSRGPLPQINAFLHLFLSPSPSSTIFFRSSNFF